MDQVIGVLTFWVVCGLVPSLLVGHLAARWQRDRTSWTLVAVFLGWPIVLNVLLIMGRSATGGSPATVRAQMAAVRAARQTTEADEEWQPRPLGPLSKRARR
jgi:hypothetical protein